MKKKLLAFARLLKTFSEVITDKGNLVCDSDIIVGSEVFVVDAEGNLVPAPTAVYESGDYKYTVESGIVIAIETTALEEPIVEETVEVMVEETVEVKEEEVVEEPIEEPIVNEELEALKVENEELKATIEELKKEIEDLKKQLEEPSADAIEEQNTVYSKQDKVKRTSLEALAKAFKNENY